MIPEETHTKAATERLRTLAGVRPERRLDKE